MDDPGTDTLRKLAPHWTLAGDEQMLSILQNTHQRLLSKCQETNCQLEQMATALNDASISLQNVNNQFMALSSSQFIESRVYDDDADTTDAPATKEPPVQDLPDELTSLKRSVAVLENAHEIITILHGSDSDSDTDDDMPARMVLKPKDMYAGRPLPYIIGSQAWKNKWHAGVQVDDSDTDSTTSKVDHDSDQYSQSEPEDTHTDKLHVPNTHDTTISETSSSLPSEQGSLPRPSPADVAGELARRLGAREPPKMVERGPEYEEPVKPTVRKIYRPQDTVPTTIFPDEPPPLSERSDSADSDIFADLLRQQPYARSQLADDLFGDHDQQGDSDGGDIFNDFANKLVTDPSAKPTSLFDAGPTPHMFDKQHASHNEGRKPHVYDKPYTSPANDRRDTSAAEDRGEGQSEVDRGVKKPVGGISLFGNKGTESIGAAILKRNQRKSSTSGDDSENDDRSEPVQTNEQQKRKEKDIFDDLFARSEAKTVKKDKVDIAKDIKSEIRKKSEVKIEKDKKAEKVKVDLFSDNLFDDIDDIFSTNVVKMPTKTNTASKSIFDDDDDLFSEIAEPKATKKKEAKSSDSMKSIFDSDDELFSENVSKPEPNEKPLILPRPIETNKPVTPKKPSKISEFPKISKEPTRSIFDDEEDDIFADVKVSNNINSGTIVQNTQISSEKYRDLDNGDKPPPKSSDIFKSPSLFDDDDDDSSIFAEPTISSKVKEATAVHIDNTVTSIKTDTRNDKSEKDVDVIFSHSVTTDNDEQNIVKDVNLNKEHKTIEYNINTNVDTTKSIKDLDEYEKKSALPVRENVDRNKFTTIRNPESSTATEIFEHINKSRQNLQQSSSEDDLSEQDFDDLPPKVGKNTKEVTINTNIVSTEISNQAPTVIDNIFDNDTLKEDILSNAKLNEISETETIPQDTEKTEYDNKTDQIVTKIIEPDIFSDILSEPPEFEKPKEPKRSKNVNALFDDDSDDESLFFKKSDVITDDKPEDFIPTQDRLFGIFADEPPDDGFSKINDDDFFSTLPKPALPQKEKSPILPKRPHYKYTLEPETENQIHGVEKKHSDESIFSKTPVVDTSKNTADSIKEPDTDKSHSCVPNTENQDIGAILSNKELFKIPTSKKPSTADRLIAGFLSDDEDLFQNSVNEPSDNDLHNPLPGLQSSPKKEVKQDTKLKSEYIPNPKSNKIPLGKPPLESTERPEFKKVGKLKIGFNINVNALLPGASPKKNKLNDLTDGQAPSMAENKNSDPKPAPEEQNLEPNTPESPESDSKIIKTVSFDGKPESEVLDSKLSKGRAKIQVKRRPSTRRARREAVRKSGIDFGEDSTDNSSSIDDPPRKNIENQPEENKKAEIEDGSSKKVEHDIVRQNSQFESLDTSKLQSNTEDIAIQPEIQPKNNYKQISGKPDIETKHVEITEKLTYSKDVKSKVVYILNDEDIFNTNPIETPEPVNKTLTTDTSPVSENPDRHVNLEADATLNKVHDRRAAKTDNSTKTSIFDEDDDEDIFKGKIVEKNPSIFDSDSEGELFGTSKREMEKQEVKKEVKREVVKGPLFGDEDDDDDLFGVKVTNNVESKPQPSRATVKETPKSTKPVFEDPLSMFGDDD